MEPDRVETTTNGGAPHTTIIERRGSGGGLLIGLAVLIAVIVGAYFLLNRSASENAESISISRAADKVGATADKAGDAIEGAAN